MQHNLPEHNPLSRYTNRRRSRALIHDMPLDKIHDMRFKWDYGPEGNNGPESFTIYTSDGKGPWINIGPLVVRVHEDSTNYDASFYLKAAPEDEARLRAYPHFHMRIFHRQGSLIWSTFMDVYAPAQNGWLIANIHFDSRWMPNPGIYELHYISPFLSWWREQAAEEYKEWERLNDTASRWWRWARNRNS